MSNHVDNVDSWITFYLPIAQAWVRAASAVTKARSASKLASVPRLARAPYTKTGLDELLQELSCVRDQGFSMIYQEVELCSIADPLINVQRQVIAALNFGWPTEDEPLEQMAARLFPEMQTVATQLRGLLR